MRNRRSANGATLRSRKVGRRGGGAHFSGFPDCKFLVWRFCEIGFVSFLGFQIARFWRRTHVGWMF